MARQKRGGETHQMGKEVNRRVEGAAETRRSEDSGPERRSVSDNMNLRWNSVLRRPRLRSWTEMIFFFLGGFGR